MGRLTRPETLSEHHDTNDFDCGVDSLNDWLKNRALKNEINQASRTFVVCREQKVVAYYCLASGSVTHIESPASIKRNMPNPISVIVLGRLAVDVSMQNQKLGDDLLRDAILRTLNAATDIGIKALLVHALSEKAKRFYLKRGFVASQTNEMTLMLPLAKAIQHLT